MSRNIVTTRSFTGGRLVLGLVTLRSALASSLLPDFQGGAKGGWQQYKPQERQHLQSTCSVEKAFTVTSSVFPLTDGCYFPKKTEDGKNVYVAAASFVYSAAIAERSNNEYWALSQDAAGLLPSYDDVVCLSSELSTEVAHPADATWECDEDSDGQADHFTTAEFSTSCGCPDIPPLTVAPNRVLPGDGTCGEPLDAILVTSMFDPELAGCYTETPSTHMNMTTYTITGTNASGQFYMFAQAQVDSSIVKWILAYQDETSPDDFVLYCHSEEEAGDVHPSEVEAWFCYKNDETTKPVKASWAEFDVFCGCNPPTSSTTSDIQTPAAPQKGPLTAADLSYPRVFITPGMITATKRSALSRALISDTTTDTCDGDFDLTSSAAPDLEGCFQAGALTTSTLNGEDLYAHTDDFGIVAVYAVEFDTTDSPLFWVLGYIPFDTATEATAYCFSNENADEVHPVDASWLCDLSGASSDFMQVTDIDLALTCGCSELTPSPSTATQPTTVAVTSVAPIAADTCDGDFDLTSSAAPDLEGCFQAGALTTSTLNGEDLYAHTDDFGTVAVYAVEFDTTDSSLFWVLGYIPFDTATEATAYCFSNENADEVHPVDASWLCDLSGASSDFMQVTDIDLALTCGCSELTPSPSTATQPTTVAVTSVAPIAADTCDGDFDLTSSAAPDLEGCFQAGALTTSTLNGEDLYAHTDDFGIVAVYAVEFDTTDSSLFWVLGYIPFDTATEATAYCFSNENADEVHPVDASWLCDLSGASSDFMQVTDIDLALTCGCSELTPSPSTATQPTTVAVTSVAPIAADTCDGDFDLTSSAAPDLEGCFQAGALTTSTLNGEDLYAHTDDFGIVAVYAVEFDTTDSSLFWVLGYIPFDTATEATAYCFSNENADEVHPVDASWLCDLSGASSDFMQVTDIDLALTCGCSELTPSPSTATQPTTVAVTSVAPIAADTCDGDFDLTSSAAPDLEGCFQAGALTTSTLNGEDLYAHTDDFGIVAVYAVEFDTTDSPLFWVLGYIPFDTATEATAYCFSNENADEVHPVDASWLCDLSGASSDFMQVTDIDLALTCGCSELTPSPSTATQPTTVAVTSVAPIAATTSPLSVSSSLTPIAADTCDGDFDLTSSAAPDLEGCFQAGALTTSTLNGEDLYAHTDDFGIVAVYAVEFNTTDSPLFWVLGYIPFDTATEATAYCFSNENADEVHPVDASWLCDFSGSSSDFTEVTEMDLALTCGCTVLTPSPLTDGDDGQREGQGSDTGSLSATLSTAITFGLGLVATVVLLTE